MPRLFTCRHVANLFAAAAVALIVFGSNHGSHRSGAVVFPTYSSRCTFQRRSRRKLCARRAFEMSGEWVPVKVPLGPNHKEFSVLHRKLSEEELADVAAANAGDLPKEELFKKYGQLFDGKGNGETVWPSSAFLAQFLVNCPSFVKGKVVFELGCGVGVAGIASAMAGASEVYLTDKDSSVLGVAERNAEINGVSDKVRVLQIDWNSQETWPQPLPQCDVIIGADILFNALCHEGLLNICTALLQDNGRAIICDPRERMVRPSFLRMCEEAGLESGQIFDTKEMVLLNLMPLVAP